MKEASGELSMTAIAVVAIAAIGLLFSQLIWPAIQQNIQRSTYCSQAFGCEDNGDGTATCSYYDDKNDKHDDLVCPNDTEEFGG